MDDPEWVQKRIAEKLGYKEGDITPNWTTNVDDALKLPIGDNTWLLDQWQDKSAWRAYIMDYSRATKHSDRGDLLEGLCEQKTLAMAMCCAWLFWRGDDCPEPHDEKSDNRDNHLPIPERYRILGAMEAEKNRKLDRLTDKYQYRRQTIEHEFLDNMLTFLQDNVETENTKREQRRFENNGKNIP